MMNALTLLSQRNSSTDVRLLFAGESATTPNLIRPPTATLDEVIKVLQQNGANLDKLKINLGWLSSDRAISWNHAKIIVADDKVVLQGGHNMWDPDYVGLRPVDDMSMVGTGSGVQASEQFIDVLWQQVTKPGAEYAVYPQGGQRLPPFAASSASPAVAGESPVIALGRLGAFNNPQLYPAASNFDNKQSSDEGIRALIDASQSELFIAQQDIYNLTQIKVGEVINLESTDVGGVVGASFALPNLAKAVLRGVKIYIIQSKTKPNLNRLYGTVKVTDAYSALVDAVEEYAKKAQFTAPNNTNLRDYICTQISYAPFRYSASWSAWANGQSLANHTKILIVDRSAVYVGSHNIYPANLQEFGMMVFDAAKTREMVTQFWDYAWPAAQSAQLSCPK
jgi:phosphatidylserine/phosphatidylglycerophosphate/cardiolipin synthase-like enzyme